LPENSSDQTSCQPDPLDELVLEEEVLDEEELDDELDDEELVDEELEEEEFDEELLDELELVPPFPPQAANERVAMIANKIRCTVAPEVEQIKNNPGAIAGV
jgi:hypothetical protein